MNNNGFIPNEQFDESELTPVTTMDSGFIPNGQFNEADLSPVIAEQPAMPSQGQQKEYVGQGLDHLGRPLYETKGTAPEEKVSTWAKENPNLSAGLAGIVAPVVEGLAQTGGELLGSVGGLAGRGAGGGAAFAVARQVTDPLRTALGDEPASFGEDLAIGTATSFGVGAIGKGLMGLAKTLPTGKATTALKFVGDKILDGDVNWVTPKRMTGVAEIAKGAETIKVAEDVLDSFKVFKDAGIEPSPEDVIPKAIYYVKLMNSSTPQKVKDIVAKRRGETIDQIFANIIKPLQDGTESPQAVLDGLRTIHNSIQDAQDLLLKERLGLNSADIDKAFLQNDVSKSKLYQDVLGITDEQLPNWNKGMADSFETGQVEFKRLSDEAYTQTTVGMQEISDKSLVGTIEESALKSQAITQQGNPQTLLPNKPSSALMKKFLSEGIPTEEEVLAGITTSKMYNELVDKAGKLTVPVANPLAKPFTMIDAVEYYQDLNKMISNNRDPKIKHILGEWQAALESDMNDFSKIIGKPEVMKSFETANKLYAANISSIRDPKILSAIKEPSKSRFASILFSGANQGVGLEKKIASVQAFNKILTRFNYKEAPEMINNLRLASLSSYVEPSLIAGKIDDTKLVSYLTSNFQGAEGANKLKSLYGENLGKVLTGVRDKAKQVKELAKVTPGVLKDIDMAHPLMKQILKVNLNDTPDKVIDIVMADVANIHKFKSMFNPDGAEIEQLKQGVISRILAGADLGSTATKEMQLHGMASVISSKELGIHKLEALYGIDGAKEVLRILDLSKAMKPEVDLKDIPAVTRFLWGLNPHTSWYWIWRGSALTSTLAGAGASLSSGVGAMALAAQFYFTPKVIARIMSKPALRKKLIYTVLEQKNPLLQKAAFNQFAGALVTQGIITKEQYRSGMGGKK